MFFKRQSLIQWQLTDQYANVLKKKEVNKKVYLAHLSISTRRQIFTVDWSVLKM